MLTAILRLLDLFNTVNDKKVIRKQLSKDTDYTKNTQVKFGTLNINFKKPSRKLSSKFVKILDWV